MPPTKPTKAAKKAATKPAKAAKKTAAKPAKAAKKGVKKAADAAAALLEKPVPGAPGSEPPPLEEPTDAPRARCRRSRTRPAPRR